MNVFFDVDGVLAIFEPCSGEPWLEEPHFFLTRKPNENAIRLYRKTRTLYEAIPLSSFPSVPVELEKEEFAKYQKDKTQWLHTHTGLAALLTCAPGNKTRAAVEYLNHRLTKRDILIDDYNPNLQEWYRAGGTAIKFLNGINSRQSWGGPCIDQNIEPEAFLKFLQEL